MAEINVHDQIEARLNASLAQLRRELEAQGVDPSELEGHYTIGFAEGGHYVAVGDRPEGVTVQKATVEPVVITPGMWITADHGDIPTIDSDAVDYGFSSHEPKKLFGGDLGMTTQKPAEDATTE